MPELPEVETVRRILHREIVGKTILDVIAYKHDIIQEMDIIEFKSNVISQTIQKVDRIGKFLLIYLDDIVIVSHLRMEGKYFIKQKEEERLKHEHVLFYFHDNSTLRYHDTRRFGTMHLRKPNEVYTTLPISKLGPEPFFETFTLSYLKQQQKRRNTTLKQFLLNQEIIAGLGNIYVDEVMFLMKKHPTTNINTLKTKDLKNLLKAAKEVLEKAIELGGTTIRSYTATLGVTGRFQNELYVHTKQDEPCLICETPIKKIKVGGRGTYFCPKCQK